jgi:hypothetical protein
MPYIRLFRCVRIAPGITLNLAKHGPSVSFKVCGAHLTVGRSGIRRTVGIPGTGVFVTSHDGWHSGLHTGADFQQSAPALSGGRKVAHHATLIFLMIICLALGIASLGAIFGR